MAGWVTDFAPTTSELNACVACGLCLPHCPTFRLTGLESASPRGRIAAMKAVAEGVLEIDADFEEAMAFCLNCRACEAVCPSMVPFGRAMEGARAELAIQRPSTTRRVRHFLLGRVLPNRGLVGLLTDAARFAQTIGIGNLLPGRAGRAFRGLRRIEATSVAESGTGPKVGLLVGCIMSKWFSSVNAASVDLLSLAGYVAVIPVTQTCCGALAVHDGAIGHGRRLAAQNATAFAGLDRVIATAAGCSAHLKSYGKIAAEGAKLATGAADITEVIAQLISEGMLPVMSAGRGRVVLHEPCHLRYAQRLTAPPRQILAAGGYEVIDADPEGLCCGAAGIYSLLRSEASKELGERLADLISEHRELIVATSNPGCEMQLRGYLDRGYRVAHPIELYLEAIRSPAAMATQGG